MFQIELIRLISFWSLFIVSSFLSVNLYMGLVEGMYDKGIMIFVAVALEGLKILCLTSANTARWQSAQKRLLHIKEVMIGSFSFLKRKKIQDADLLRDIVDSSKKSKRAFLYYVAYLLTAFLSISASFGYILQTVDRATAQALSAPTNNQTITIYEQSLNNIDFQIKGNQDSIVQYNRYIDALDLEDVRFQQKRDTYQKNIDTLQAKNTALLEQKLIVNTKIQDLKLQDVAVVKIEKKTMYQLMGEVLKFSDKTIMFILLYLLAILIEIGIFICSPHFKHMEDESKPTSPLQKKNESILDKKKKEVYIEPEVVIEKDISFPITTVAKDIKTEEKKPVVLKEENISNPVTEVTKVTKVTEVKEEIPVRIPQRKSDFERYIDALFSNSGKTNLKERTAAAKDASITPVQASKFFTFLSQAKGDTNHTLIEFRREFNDWFPNYTSEYTKDFVLSHYKGV